MVARVQCIFLPCFMCSSLRPSLGPSAIPDTYLALNTFFIMNPQVSSGLEAPSCPWFHLSSTAAFELRPNDPRWLEISFKVFALPFPHLCWRCCIYLKDYADVWSRAYLDCRWLLCH